MLKKLKKIARTIAAPPEPVNIAQFNDPLANTISWEPAKRGGSNFKTHKFISDGFNRAEFKMSVSSRIFALLFMTVGAGMPAFFIYSGEFGTLQETVILIGFGLIFVAVGGLIHYFYGRPIIFDKMKGFYWKGWKNPDHTTARVVTKNLLPLSEIHALQLIKEFVRSDKSTYYSYELNLVLRDGTRVNVVDHGNGKILKQDAQQLSSFLGKPLWDVS
ncbi:MAG: hypothetical protein EA391_09345 [Balneolaceae bacterium]|nr:MAG: hypothetical protein EA391_09345 [Balneolaceae bacterium]